MTRRSGGTDDAEPRGAARPGRDAPADCLANPATHGPRFGLLRVPPGVFHLRRALGRVLTDARVAGLAAYKTNLRSQLKVRNRNPRVESEGCLHKFAEETPAKRNRSSCDKRFVHSTRRGRSLLVAVILETLT